jgi:hypothetical protein
MFSLHRYLLEQGYDAEVLSHWYFKNKDEVLGLHNKSRGIKGFLKLLVDFIMVPGVTCQYWRERKLSKWLDGNIRWSRESGVSGEFKPEKLPHDIVIVGSDQIWNPIHETSKFFLLTDFPDRIKKVAYAASMGTDKFIDSEVGNFSEALKRFSAVSVREKSAVCVCEKILAQHATLVCDPTLLHTKEDWIKLLGLKLKSCPTDDLVVYLVTPDYKSKWRELIRVAKESRRKVHFFAFQWSQWMPHFSWRHPLKGMLQLMKSVVKRLVLFFAGVRLHLSATPTEFVQCIANSSGLLTDSFHGMMFATIFEKKCNVVIGVHSERQQMSARLRNFTGDFGDPTILTPTFDIKAMKKLGITSKLESLISFSKVWLKSAIEE